MNPWKNNRFFWHAGAFSLLVLVLLGTGYLAMEQARSLQERARDLQTHTAPLLFGFNDVEANFSALRTADALLRTQLNQQPAPLQFNLPESVPADVYLARINSDLQHLAELELGVKARVEFFALRNAVSRFAKHHAEYRALAAAGRYDKAVSYFDNALLVSGTETSRQISTLIDHYQQQEQTELALVDQAFSATFWAIFVCLGLAVAACLLIASWQLRAAWRRAKQAALFAAMSQEEGVQSAATVDMLVETSRQLHSLATFPTEAQPLEMFSVRHD